jgi:uncharacterized protein (TIGR02594 family)
MFSVKKLLSGLFGASPADLSDDDIIKNTNFHLYKHPYFDQTRNPLEIAKAYLGRTETEDTKVLAEFMKNAAGLKLNPRQTAWCAGFANAVLGASGFKGTGSLMAKSFLKYGVATTKPKPGDIVVFWRDDPKGPFGHVGFFVKVQNGMVYTHGGNQNDSVNITAYPMNRVEGYRTHTGQIPNFDEFSEFAEPVNVTDIDRSMR